MTANDPRRYVPGELLGRGSTAEVFRAELPDVDGPWRHAAVKRIQGEENTEELGREAQLACRLDHPNIVSIYDVQRDDSGLSIVMELVEGTTLAALTKQHVLPWSVAVYVVHELLHALAHAESQGIMHRDVAPKNVLVSREGTVKLGDFGFARPVIDDEHEQRSDCIIGTPAYLAPETLRVLERDHRADLYAVGVILFELLTGQLPHGNVSMTEYFSRVVSQPVRSPGEIVVGVPDGLDAFVLRLLHIDRDKRFASADDAIRALEPLLSEEGDEILANLVSGRSDDRVPRERIRVQTSSVSRSWSGRLLATMVLVAALLGGVAVVISAVSTHDHGPIAAGDEPEAAEVFQVFATCETNEPDTTGPPAMVTGVQPVLTTAVQERSPGRQLASKAAFSRSRKEFVGKPEPARKRWGRAIGYLRPR